ncbi:MAG: adenylate/guanylate cyclase domain-containing protein [Pseudomonadota bacterium]
MSVQDNVGQDRAVPIGLYVRRVRIVTGVILFTFATTHFINHALGLYSLQAMEVGQTWRWKVTRSDPGSFILFSAVFIHLVLGLSKFFTRRTWRMSAMEGVQLLLGLLIPVLLLPHIIGTLVIATFFGFDTFYAWKLSNIWPHQIELYAIMMAMVWVHGTIGIHMWLRMSPTYQRLFPWLLGIAVLIPTLGFLGVVSGGREIAAGSFPRQLTADQYYQLEWWEDLSSLAFLGVVAGLLALKLIRDLVGRFRTGVDVSYVGGRAVHASPGQTLLEISRSHGIPHASVCGGRARCSTCRVRIIEGVENQPVPDATEARLLKRIGARDQSMRLACQLRPVGHLRVATLLPADRTGPHDVAELDRYHWGVEQTVTLLFSDMRGFTQFSEKRLPYDVVFVLNRYLGALSDTIIAEGGYVDKFMGDGIMAIFTVDRGKPKDSTDAARAAIRAGMRMGQVLEEMNEALAPQLEAPLRIGIGLHTGPAVLGRIGAAKSHHAGDRVTALGDTVNTASRLESATKELGVQTAISVATLEAAGYSLEKAVAAGGTAHDLPIRGRTETLPMVGFDEAPQVATLIKQS